MYIRKYMYLYKYICKCIFMCQYIYKYMSRYMCIHSIIVCILKYEIVRVGTHHDYAPLEAVIDSDTKEALPHSSTAPDPPCQPCRSQ